MKDFVNINFSEELIEQIVNSLDTEGYYCSEAALRLDTIKEFEIEIHRLLDLHGHRYFSLINLAKDNKSPFHILEKSRNFTFFTSKSNVSSITKQRTALNFASLTMTC